MKTTIALALVALAPIGAQAAPAGNPPTVVFCAGSTVLAEADLVKNQFAMYQRSTQKPIWVAPIESVTIAPIGERFPPQLSVEVQLGKGAGKLTARITDKLIQGVKSGQGEYSGRMSGDETYEFEECQLQYD